MRIVHHIIRSSVVNLPVWRGIWSIVRDGIWLRGIDRGIGRHISRVDVVRDIVVGRIGRSIVAVTGDVIVLNVVWHIVVAGCVVVDWRIISVIGGIIPRVVGIPAVDVIAILPSIAVLLAV